MVTPLDAPMLAEKGLPPDPFATSCDAELLADRLGRNAFFACRMASESRMRELRANRTWVFCASAMRMASCRVITPPGGSLVHVVSWGPASAGSAKASAAAVASARVPRARRGGQRRTDESAILSFI